jgi:isoaspartyl peptidase/L-asparaginase-like protein (Ntn-hydrolase superfamily)
MLVGAGANKFALEVPFRVFIAQRAEPSRWCVQMGIPALPTDALVTKQARQYYEEFKKYGHATDTLFNKQEVHDTVGAVAIDLQGNLAAATSTGGIPGGIPVLLLGTPHLPSQPAALQRKWQAVLATALS